MSMDEILRDGARRMLQKAIEDDDYIARHAQMCDAENGRRLVVRNGRLPGKRASPSR